MATAISVAITTFVTTVGFANRKIDSFEITCKVLLCVGVGLIKKMLMWPVHSL